MTDMTTDFEVFNEIDKAKIGGAQRPFASPGNYICRVDRAGLGKTRKGQKYFQVDLTVLAVGAARATDAEVLAYRESTNTVSPAPHSIGEEICIRFNQQYDSFLPNVKAFLVAAMGVDESEVTKEVAVQACQDGAMLQWSVIQCMGYEVLTKNKGEPFTVWSFPRHVAPQEIEQTIGSESYERHFPASVREFFEASE